jgi:hypothetical protein
VEGRKMAEFEILFRHFPLVTGENQDIEYFVETNYKAVIDGTEPCPLW